MIGTVGMPLNSSGVNWYWPPLGRPATKMLAATSPPPPSALSAGTAARISAWLLELSRSSVSADRLVSATGVFSATRPLLVPVTMISCATGASAGAGAWSARAAAGTSANRETPAISDFETAVMIPLLTRCPLVADIRWKRGTIALDILQPTISIILGLYRARGQSGDQESGSAS